MSVSIVPSPGSSMDRPLTAKLAASCLRQCLKQLTHDPLSSDDLSELLGHVKEFLLVEISMARSREVQARVK